MTDSTLNRFLASGTNAERIAFTPDPPSPASGPDPSYVWLETDTGNTFAWDYSGAAWVQITGSASAAWSLIYSNAAIPNPTATIDVDVSGYEDVLIIGRLVTLATAAFCGVQLSVDGGATYKKTNGDYINLPTNGVEAATFIAFNPSAAATAARSFFGTIVGANVNGAPKLCTGWATVLFVASNLPVDHIRVCGLAASAGANVNMTGGQLYVFAR